MRVTATLLLVAVLGTAAGQEYGGHALFVRTSPSAVRQQSEGYLPPYSTQRPPERPRPFQAPSTAQQSGYSSPVQTGATNYPYQRPSSLYTPQAGPPGQSVGPTSGQVSPFSTPRPTYVPPSSPSGTGFSPSNSYNARPSATQPTYANTGSSAFPPLTSTRGSTTYLPPPSGFPSTSVRPPSTTQTPPSSGGYSAGVSTSYGFTSTQRPTVDYGSASIGTGSSGSGTPSGGYSTPGGFSSTYGYSSQRPVSNFPSTRDQASSGVSKIGYPSPSGFTTYGYPSESPSPSFPTPGTGSGGAFDNDAGGYPPSTRDDGSTAFQTPEEGTGGTASTKRPGTSGTSATGGTTGEGSMGTSTTTGEGEDDPLKHPPHIHALDVECSKTMMTINIEFNRAFDGVIYSKGYFMSPECRYVEQNSGQTKYSFTVSLDSCGTQFINDFMGEAGQAYLENVLVLQNEPGIQEVWDTVRRVRCLWEGNINKALTVNFSVDMLNQEIVTFSGDTATAKLDIQVGRGPFAPAADGLVKIGETMTLVVSVEGDPAFDLQVRDCVARDESSTNTIQLTDERGCILKPKLFGAFQKTNDTGNTGASIIAYAFFQAFKFPDVMDLFIECNVELCKTDCEPCPESDQQIEPGRRRRSIPYIPSNTSAELLSDAIRVGRGFKVILLDDLSEPSNIVFESPLRESVIDEIARTTNVCLSNNGFYTAISLMLSVLLATTISAVIFYVKLQRVYRTKSFAS